MNRQQLEHVLRASAAISGCRELIVVGSQALLASHPDASADLARSIEVDLYPLADPRRSDLIDAAIGELSSFHDTFGYYAHGVGPETAVLPRLWRERCVRIETEGAVAYCPSPADLAVSKLVAGRPVDFEFVRALLREEYVDARAIEVLLEELDPPVRRVVTSALEICLGRS